MKQISSIWLYLGTCIFSLSACLSQPSQVEPAVQLEANDPQLVAEKAVDTIEEANEAFPQELSNQPTTTDDQPSDSIVKTDIGDFQIVSSRFEDQVRGDTAGPNEKILVMTLTQPGSSSLDPATFPLEEFEQVRSDILIEVSWAEPPDYPLSQPLTSDGTVIAICPMAGWLETDFVIGCKVPVPADSYRLRWGENTPIILSP